MGVQLSVFREIRGVLKISLIVWEHGSWEDSDKGILLVTIRFPNNLNNGLLRLHTQILTKVIALSHLYLLQAAIVFQEDFDLHLSRIEILAPNDSLPSKTVSEQWDF